MDYQDQDRLLKHFGANIVLRQYVQFISKNLNNSFLPPNYLSNNNICINNRAKLFPYTPLIPSINATNIIRFNLEHSCV